jgi:hypothetical protein
MDKEERGGGGGGGGGGGFEGVASSMAGRDVGFNLIFVS